MRRCFALSFVIVGLLLTSVLFAQAPAANPPVRATAYATTREIPFTADANFLKLPEGLYLGEGIGVARNSRGHIFVYTRSGEQSRLFEFDEKGAYVREIGRGLYAFQMAHAVRVDSEDNIWVVDEGTDMVIKFNPQGRVVMTMGRRPESHGFVLPPAPGTPPPVGTEYRFGRPTDIAWDKQGNIFISDGYTNSRAVKYDKFGKFIKAVGTRGREPNQMNTPHAIQVDANGTVYVGDRGNRRIQVFSNDLTLRAIYDNVGAPWTLCITPGPHQYLYSSNSNPDNNNSLLAAVSGEIYKMELDGTVIGRFGKAGKEPGNFTTTHAIDCRNENELIISEITGWRVQKFTLRPQGPPTSSK